MRDTRALLSLAGPWPVVLATHLTVAALAPGCGGSNTGAEAPAGGPPATGVKIITLTPRPIPETSEFIATLRSLQSTTIQPQVEGFVQRIFVRSGERVEAGAPLIQIDPEKQKAAVGSLESARAAREADVAFARQQAQRLTALYEAGAVSQQELEVAQTSLQTTEAQLKAIDAQIREASVELEYFRVTAPVAGTVGDIPIRVGDRVTNETIITTIDRSAGLEAYVQVPLERAPQLRLGLPVELLDVDGTVSATNPVSFVAPRVDEQTQTVLVKSLLRDVPEGMRVQQFVRARIVWRTRQALAVPVVAVSRVSGQYFCFVAEQQAQGLVARQRPVQVGEVAGDDYVILTGLEAGDRVIVSGIQKLGDGAPVQPEA
jgi:RND family efflux transporter MFP subunit